VQGCLNHLQTEAFRHVTFTSALHCPFHGWLCFDLPTTPEAVPEQALPQVGVVAVEHLDFAFEPDDNGRQFLLAAPIQLPHATHFGGGWDHGRRAVVRAGCRGQLGTQRA